MDYEPFLLEGLFASRSHLPTILEQKTRRDSRLSSYVILSVLELLTDYDSELEGSPTRAIAIKDLADLSLAKGPASKGPPKTADRRCGQLSVAVCGHTSEHNAGVAGKPRIQ